ncbi:MAG TPA: hypothetical protein VGK46_00235 [Saprospiraceae bacterium]
MKGILVAILLLASFTGWCQPTLLVDKTLVKIGDQVKATIRTDMTGDKEWININEVWPDSLAGVEVVSRPIIYSQNPRFYEATWMVSIFDTGWVKLPPLPVVIKSQGQTDTLFTNDVPINVLKVEPDSLGLADLKEIYFEPFSPGYYKKYIPHILIFLLLIGGLIYWLREGKSKQLPDEPTPIPVLPHEWALNALDELAAKKLWQRGEVKEHYSELTAIFREYLERRYTIHAKEQTSDEILAQLHQLQLKPELLADTEELISIADLIKFAKADPGMNIHTAAIERVRSFVLETLPQVQSEEEENSKETEEDGVE